MRTLLVLFFVASAVCVLTPAEQFRNFIVQHKKTYATFSERQARFEVFVENLKRIDEYNSANDGAHYGITQFADLTEDEFMRRMTMPPVIPVRNYRNTTRIVGAVPDSLDWRSRNAVTSVKDQGNCGSCWTFGVGQNAEGVWAVKTGSLLQLSSQQLLDCDHTSKGCQGGYPDKAAKYVAKNGIMLERDYPYTAIEGTCKYDRQLVAATFSSSKSTTSDLDLQETMNTFGPAEITLYADTKFQLYTSGIWAPTYCQMINHSVLAVGWGVDASSNTPYWIVKNSWGPGWGEQGYIRVKRSNNCIGPNGVTVLP